MSQFYRFGEFQIDTAKRILLRNDQAVPLTPKLYETLVVLVENRHRVLEKNDMLEMIWPNTFVEEANLAQNVSTLRKVLGEAAKENKYIATLPGRGYQFVADVQGLTEEVSVVVSDHTTTRIVIGPGVEADDRADYDSKEKDRLGAPLTRQNPRYSAYLNSKVIVLCAVIVALSGFFAYRWLLRNEFRSPVNAKRRLAILPFKPLATETDDDGFGAGMTDALIISLSKLPKIVVRPTNAVRNYNKPGQDPLEAGQRLKVDSVLDGTIQRTGNRVRVTVQLLNVADGSSQWSDKFEENFTNVFAIQDKIAERVARALTVELTGEDSGLLAKRYTNNPEAYRYYIKGRWYWNRRSTDDITKAIEQFELAVQSDPNYALAYTGLADSYSNLASGVEYSRSPREAMPKAKEAAIKALEIDDTLAEAHTSLGIVYLVYDWDWAGAEREFKRALEINPNYSTAHYYNAIFLAAMGRKEESIESARLALENEPASLSMSSNYARILFFARRYDQARDQLMETLKMDPNFIPGNYVLGSVYEQMGRYDDAISAFQKADDLSHGSTTTQMSLAHAYGASGRRDEALSIAASFEERLSRQYIPPYYLYKIYLGLHDRDKAIQWLTKAYEERSGLMIYIGMDPNADWIRSDPAFVDLLNRVGLKR